jgi:hypothetical protein
LTGLRGGLEAKLREVEGAPAKRLLKARILLKTDAASLAVHGEPRGRPAMAVGLFVS